MDPFPLFANQTAPFGYACPQYAAGGCCNRVQNQLLYVNFLMLHSYFGDVAQGGCPACEQNLREMWCAFTCGPDQDKYALPVGLENITNPTSGVITTVLNTRVTIASKYACSIFASCSATAKVKTFSPMNSCEGLMSYQGGTGAIPQGAYLTFDYSGDAEGKGADPDAMSLPYHNCCSFPANFSNPAGGNISCPCASCSGCCGGGSCYDGLQPATSSGGSGGSDVNISLADLGNPNLSALTGFNGVAVGGLYGGLLALSVCVLGANRLGWGKGEGAGHSELHDDHDEHEPSQGSYRLELEQEEEDESQSAAARGARR